MNPKTNTITDQETLNTPAALVERYIAIWNERDAARRHELITQTWTEEASYCDPHRYSEGHAALDAMIQAVQEGFPGCNFHQRNGVDAHNNYLRFSWELVPEGGEAIAGGTDFATVAADGRLQRIVSFLDFLPADRVS